MADGTDQTFSDIIRGMQYAVNTAQETLQDHQFSLMQKYFKEDGSPYTVIVKLSDGRELEIPQITLVPQSLLAIQKLEMSFKVNVAHTEVKPGIPGGKEGGGAEGAEPERSSFHVQFARRVVPGEMDAKGEKEKGVEAGVISVHIKFKSIAVPEGAARVLDALNLDIVERKGG